MLANEFPNGVWFMSTELAEMLGSLLVSVLRQTLEENGNPNLRKETGGQ